MSKVTSLTISKQCRLHPFQSKILLLSSSLQMYIRSFVCSENVTTSSSCSPLTAIHVTRISFEFINSIMHLCKIPLRGSTALSVYMYIVQVTAFGFTAKRSTELFRSSVKENVMCVCHKYIHMPPPSPPPPLAKQCKPFWLVPMLLMESIWIAFIRYII